MYDIVPIPPAPEPPLPAAAPAVTHEDGHPAPELSFWRRKWVHDVLPWATSIVIHAGLIILALATYKAAGKFLKVVQEQIIIPDATMAPDPGGIPNPGMSNDRTRTAAQNVDSITESQGFSNRPSDLTALAHSASENPADNAAMLIGATAHDRGVAGPEGLNSGGLAQFGNPGGGQIGPRGKVFGHGGNALRIIYICDASGSMMTKMDLLKVELEKSIEQLQPIQAFNVIFFQDSVQNPASHIDFQSDLVMATAGNKRKVYTFLQDIVGQSSTHVIPALTAAFRSPTRPDLIYLLTDGAFEDETGPVVAGAIAKLNADHRVKVNTILFLGHEIDPDELKEASQTMQKIATANGGVYTRVSIDELGN